MALDYFEPFSRRNRNIDKDPDVYEYDSFDHKLINKIFYIIKNMFSEYILAMSDRSIWETAYLSFCELMGYKQLSSSNVYSKGFEEFMSKCSTEELIDIIDFIFQFYLDKVRKNLTLTGRAREQIDKLNFCLKQHNMGYEFIKNELIRVDNEHMHKEVIKPAIRLLHEVGFDSANQSFFNAFENYRLGNNETAIIEACKAFESTMKKICMGLAYEYSENKSSAKDLIGILKDKGFIPAYSEAHLNSLSNSLISGLPTVRNKNAGHGPADVRHIGNELVEYALNLSATNIIFLVKLYKNHRTQQHNPEYSGAV